MSCMRMGMRRCACGLYIFHDMLTCGLGMLVMGDGRCVSLVVGEEGAGRLRSCMYSTVRFMSETDEKKVGMTMMMLMIDVTEYIIHASRLLSAFSMDWVNGPNHIHSDHGRV